MNGTGLGVLYGVLIIAAAVAVAAAVRWWRLRSTPPRPDPTRLTAEFLAKRKPESK